MRIERDQDAAGWAVELRHGDALFKGLAVGERFRFNNFTTTFVKKNARRYTAPDGNTYTTGARTSVWRVTC